LIQECCLNNDQFSLWILLSIMKGFTIQYTVCVMASDRVANHLGMAGIVPELTHGVPGDAHFCPGNVKIDHRAWIYGCSLMSVLYFVLFLSVTHDVTCVCTEI